MSRPRSSAVVRARAQLLRAARAALLAPVALAACDLGGGPSGPASVLGTITGSETLGAAVVDLSWDGVLAFEGRGETRVYSAAVSGEGERYRMVLVDPVGGELRFTIRLEDDLLYAPVLTVVSAVGTNNLPLAVESLRVVLER